MQRRLHGALRLIVHIESLIVFPFLDLGTYDGLWKRVMGNRKYQALLIGFKEVDVLRTISTLGAMDIDYHRAPWAEGLDRHLMSHRYDAILLLCPTEKELDRFLAVVRADNAPNLCAGVVALAESDRLDMANRYLGHGVNRVVPFTEAGDCLRESLVTLLEVARRYALRIPLQLSAIVDNQPVNAHCNTENVSSSGMLVACSARLTVGTPFEFVMSPPETEPICGTARVARIADPEREQVLGIGATFLTVPAEHRTRLDTLLSAKTS
jgi:hypothetical protein